MRGPMRWLRRLVARIWNFAVRRPMRWLRRLWVSLADWERWIFYVAWPLAAALFVLSTWVVDNDWWDDHAFLLEVASSFTAFLFGAPIAIAILGRLSEHVAKRVEWLTVAREAHNLALIVMKTLEEACGADVELTQHQVDALHSEFERHEGSGRAVLRDVIENSPHAIAIRAAVSGLRGVDSFSDEDLLAFADTAARFLPFDDEVLDLRQSVSRGWLDLFDPYMVTGMANLVDGWDADDYERTNHDLSTLSEVYSTASLLASVCVHVAFAAENVDPSLERTLTGS